VCHTVAFHHKRAVCLCVCVCVWHVIMHTCMYGNNVREIGCNDVDLINLFQCRVHCIDSALWKWLFHASFNV